MMHGYLCVVVGAASGQSDLPYVWKQATPEAKAIIVFLIFFSIIAWSVIGYKVVQMRRAKRLNYYFNEEFRAQKAVMDIFDRKLQVEGCPLYAVYETGCSQLDARLKGPGGERRKQSVSIKNMEHIKRALENVVAQESLKLESGLIWLSVAATRRAIHRIARNGLGRDERVCGHRAGGFSHAGGNGARCRRCIDNHGGGPARGDSFHVRIQLARP